MKLNFWLIAFLVLSSVLIGCYPDESDTLETIDVEMPIDTLVVEEGVSTFTIGNQEIKKAGNGFICNVFDVISGETTRYNYISTGEFVGDVILFYTTENDIIISQVFDDTYNIFILSDAEGEEFEYRCFDGSAAITFTTMTDSEFKGTWTGNFDKSADGIEWESVGAISGSFHVPVSEVECE